MRILTESSAERIAAALDKPRQTGPGRWLACCPAHHDKDPSLSLTERGDTVLWYCYAGCSQEDVRAALVRLELWHERKQKRAKVSTIYESVEVRAFVAAHEYNLRRGITTATRDRRRYRQFLRVICAPFTPDEVIDAHLYRMAYRDAVRRGEVPTEAEDERFMVCARVREAMRGFLPYEA